MFARVHTLETTPEQHDAGLEIVRDQLLPWLRESTGFRGLIRLERRDGERTLVVSLWADEASLEASAEVGDHLSKLTADAVGVTRLDLADYEVTLFDVLG